VITFSSVWQTVVIYVKFSISLKLSGKKVKIPGTHPHHWNTNTGWFGKQKLRKWWLHSSYSDLYLHKWSWT